MIAKIHVSFMSFSESEHLLHFYSADANIQRIECFDRHVGFTAAE